MPSFLRIGLVLLAIIGVSALGYYAFTLSTDTLRYASVGQENQQGNTMRLIVARPTFLSIESEKPIFDTEAVKRALTLDGKKWDPTVSGEGMFLVSGEYIEVHSSKLAKDSSIVLDANAYNDAKTTGYRLPRSITLTNTEKPRDIRIERVGLPRDTTFSVEMYGYPGLSRSDIRWYIHHDTSRSCDISAWDSQVWDTIPPVELSHDDKAQISRGQYRVAYDTTTPYTCMIAGVGGDYVLVVDEAILTFSATGAIASMLSPEYDLQSEIEFRLSHDVFSDTGTLYSDAYIEHRRKQKIEFLKLLDISPMIPLTEENIIMTPDKITVLAKFEEGIEYKIRLQGLSDEYGRIANVSMDFTPVSEPFLSLGLPSRRTMFRAGEDIGAKLYSIKTPKDAYTMKLCRVSMEGYARAERMITEGRREDIDTLYSMLDGGVETSNCTKKDIMIASGSSVSSFRLQDMYASQTLTPGLYILAPREKEVAMGFSRIVLPRVFSVVDTQVTMKVDASGKMQFLATDINTGAPRGGQSLKLNKNILKTYTESWDAATNRSIKTYLPFTNRAFATGVVLGQTQSDGTLSVVREALIDDEYSPPYGLMYEWYYDYEGEYQSFVATVEGEGHFGYVVSTWNDGITGWNFGLKDSDYSWETRGQYLGYIHTDRKLYLPGEKVYIHAILRKNSKTLEIPTGEKFTIKVTSPLGVEIVNRIMQANEFGTISLDFDISPDATLGSYMVQVIQDDANQFGVENGYTNFQVEVFKNPTFTADVKLKSSDIEGDMVLNLRKRDNTDTSSPWYTDVYNSTFYIDGIVRARYYNGAEMKGIPFTYRIYRAPYYDSSYWGDCFWGCYWQPAPEFYTEGTGTIDHDGMGVLRVGVDFSSFYDDYMYTAEVTIADPLTGETVVTPGTLLARLPAEYKAFDPYNPLVFTPLKKMVQPGSSITGTLALKSGKWDKSLTNKYRYELIHREYTRVLVDDLRIRDTAITDSEDTVVLSGSITSSGLSISTQGLSSGEYHVRISPITDSIDSIPESSISETLIYITGDFVDRNANLRVIPEKTVYKRGETAHVIITTPFTGGYIYITRERAGVLDYEYVKLTGNTITREYIIDDSFFPNVYIGAVAFSPGYTHGARNYAVGYGEIVTDLSDKKANITITPDKKTYKNREKVNLTLKLTDRQGAPLLGEVAVMVVDESLIRLLGNIDLDIIPKFFRKAPFTMKTALTSIGMEKNRFLSRRGSNGGSGDKGGLGSELASRILFKNTAYYNPTVRTDKTGIAKIVFELPDNVTNYRIITIGQTKDSLFAVGEETIQVRRDYTLETHVPTIAYPGDTFEATFSAFNSTKKITNAELVVRFGSGVSTFESKNPLILQAISSTPLSLRIPVSPGWKGDIPYTVTLIEKGVVLDSVTRILRILDIPRIDDVSRISGMLTGAELSLPLTSMQGNIDPKASRLIMSISRGPLRDPAQAIASLISYPYGCIEQTISSTLPNAIALKYARTLGLDIDTQTAQKNLDVGVAKILRMQVFGGWKYWEDDYEANIHVTPYVIRSLYVFRDMGVDIPLSSIDAGIQYLVDRLDWQNAAFSSDPDFYAEVFATLARTGHPRAESLISRLEDSRKSGKLSRHGLLMYSVGLQYLGKLQAAQLTELGTIMEKKDTKTYWYWDSYADLSIYASLLIDRGDMTAAMRILEELSRTVNMNSYYVSTQTKIQFFSALVKASTTLGNNTKDISLELRSDGFMAGLSLLNKTYSDSLTVFREVTSDALRITRKDSLSPVFYELLQYDTPRDIYAVRPISSLGMEVSRAFELVDESKGVDTTGNWLVTKPLENKLFKKGQLYKVILTVTPPLSDGPTYYLTLEDYMPGAWRPIRGVFRTESQTTTDDNNFYWNGWSHVEARNDRILATADSLWSSKPQTYTYYIRPEYTGKYLLPPVTAYYMYRPEVHAIGRYEKIEVVE